MIQTNNPSEKSKMKIPFFNKKKISAAIDPVCAMSVKLPKRLVDNTNIWTLPIISVVQDVIKPFKKNLKNIYPEEKR